MGTKRAALQAGWTRLSGPDQSSSDQALVEVLGIATALSSASDLRTLLHLILSKCRQLTNSDAGSIFLVERPDPRKQPEGEEQLWFAVSQNATIKARTAGDGSGAAMEAQVFDIRFPLSPERLVGWCALSGEVLNIPDVYQLDPALPYRFDSAMDRQLDYRAVSMLTLPMRSTSGEVVGVVQLINRKRDAATLITPETAHALTRPFDRFDQTLIEALASQAAVCVERTRLLESLEQLIDAIIALLAGAIDAKSPYTGGHCERVPKHGGHAGRGRRCGAGRASGRLPPRGGGRLAGISDRRLAARLRQGDDAGIRGRQGHQAGNQRQPHPRGAHPL